MQNLYRTAAVVTVFTTFEHCLGFLYRIILSRILGSEGLGVYQVALSVFAVFITLSSSGLPITLSRTISKHRAAGRKRKEQAATSAALVISLLFSVPITVLLYLLRAPFSKIFSDPRCADLFYIMLFSLSFTSVYSIIRGYFWGNKRFFAYSLIELMEEIIMILVGVCLLLFTAGGIPDVNKAAVAVLISYLCSFGIALVYFLIKGGRLRSPKGEFLPLLKASLPVTAMRASSSLINSFISVIFPLRLMAAGYSSSRALSVYGVICGMVMPVLTIPSTMIGSMALVLVPELSECYYKKETAEVRRLISRALNSTLLIAAVLIPLFIVCGEGVGVFLFSSAESGVIISRCAFMLLPMSLTMISTSLLNSMNCERHTLLFFVCGSIAMLLCVFFLPKYLGSGALLVGMGCDYLITALCSLVLLKKKAGKLGCGTYFLKLALATLPALALGTLCNNLLMTYANYLLSLAVSALAILLAEGVCFTLLGLIKPRALLSRFFVKKRKKAAAHS